MSIACMFQIASQHASTVGTAGSKSSKSMAALNNAVRHATDGFIGILDMFGFEDPKVSGSPYNFQRKRDSNTLTIPKSLASIQWV